MPEQSVAQLRHDFQGAMNETAMSFTRVKQELQGRDIDVSNVNWRRQHLWFRWMTSITDWSAMKLAWLKQIKNAIGSLMRLATLSGYMSM